MGWGDGMEGGSHRYSLRPARSHTVCPAQVGRASSMLPPTSNLPPLIPRQSRSLRVSALHCCAIGGHPGVAEILIEAGADTNLRDGVREVTLLQLLVHSCMLC